MYGRVTEMVTEQAVNGRWLYCDTGTAHVNRGMVDCVYTAAEGGGVPLFALHSCTDTKAADPWPLKLLLWRLSAQGWSTRI